MSGDFSHILCLLSSVEKKLRGGNLEFMRLMKEIDAVSLAPSELLETEVVFFVSCSWASHCLSFLHLSEVFEVVFGLCAEEN